MRRYSVSFNHQEDEFLRKMAKEAGISTSDIIEIACYNLIALYIKDQNKGSYDIAEPSNTNNALALDI